jgi:integrase
MTSIGSGVYLDPESGFFYVRPTIQGKRTWRKLGSIRQREAIEEARVLFSDQKRAERGLADDPFSKDAGTVSELIAAYLKAGCPHRRGTIRTAEFIAGETRRLGHVQRILGGLLARDVRLQHTLKYADRRLPKVLGGRGARSVEAEMNALSNVFNYAVARGLLEINYIRNGRITPQCPVVHCRERMPQDGDELNELAALLLRDGHSSAALGWQFLFEAMTGCRTTEVLRWRMDAKEGQPGHIHGDRLDLQRVKGGVSPWVIIHDDLRELIIAHHAWHTERYSASPWWFPGYRGENKPVSPKALTHRLRALTKGAGRQLVTSHGLRAYFVTKMRRDGHADEDVAEMIGDKTVDLIQSTYGERRVGESRLSWRRADGTAVWARADLRKGLQTRSPDGQLKPKPGLVPDATTPCVQRKGSERGKPSKNANYIRESHSPSHSPRLRVLERIPAALEGSSSAPKLRIVNDLRSKANYSEKRLA